jgi:hypothetical protein
MRRIILALAAIGTVFAGLTILPKAEAAPVVLQPTVCATSTDACSPWSSEDTLP